MKKQCKNCGAPLYQAEDLKWFCLSCLAADIEARDKSDRLDGSWKVLHPRTKPITLRLSEADLSRAKERARRIGKPYQTFLKEIIHEAVSERPPEWRRPRSS